MMGIDPLASVSPDARLADDVTVGAFALIGPSVTIGSGTIIGPYTRVEGPTRIGERNHFYGHASVGGPPQDLKYHEERTELVIGNDNFFMAYAHVAHDCHVGSNTIFANCATLAGHVEVGDFAQVGAFSAVHQFCRVGEHAFIGGGTMCTQDVLPYAKTVASRDNATYGINTIGLQRKGFSPETIEALQRAYKLLVRSKLKLEDALMQIENDLSPYPEARYLVEFVRSSKRGVIR